MRRNYSNEEIDKLILLISKLPGYGPKSASRAVLHLLKRKDHLMVPLSESLLSASKNILTCENCGNIDLISPCTLCTDEQRDQSQLCVVEDVSDLWAFEKAELFSGNYHVLGGTLSAINGVGPDDLKVRKLIERAQFESVTEVILALSTTVDGATTSHYVADCLKDSNVVISQLGQGIPIAGELDYLDSGTLFAAFNSRKKI